VPLSFEFNRSTKAAYGRRKDYCLTGVFMKVTWGFKWRL
jgi:hypothetical protein